MNDREKTNNEISYHAFMFLMLLNIIVWATMICYIQFVLISAEANCPRYEAFDNNRLLNTAYEISLPDVQSDHKSDSKKPHELIMYNTETNQASIQTQNSSNTLLLKADKVLSLEENNLANKKQISINPVVSQNGLSDISVIIVNNIHSIINGICPDDSNIDMINDLILFDVEGKVDPIIINEIAGHLAFYYNDTSIWHSLNHHYFNADKADYYNLLLSIQFRYDASSNNTTITFPRRLIPIWKEARIQYEKKAINILTTNIKDSSDMLLLGQICNYFLQENNSDATPAQGTTYYWDNNSGTCLSVAMAFKQLVEMAGLECDIIVGYTDDGGYHAWNRVTLSDQTYRYYDVRFFLDTEGEHIYIHQKHPLHNEQEINTMILSPIIKK